MSRLVIYHARDGWRWRLVAKNNRIVAESGEAYEALSNAKRAAGRLFWHVLFNWREVK
jgi:uncharacterized protein YegP (UPF0339 family)